ncbi:MAG: 3'-5' exonuclease, partial [Paramuribaculum sp.]|nr:3'-5' exonuclease [Paramuribaculum sp.]
SQTRFVDVQPIFHKKEQRTLVAAYKFYCGKDLEEAHSANADTRATYEVLKAQLDHYPDLKNDIPTLAEYSSHSRNVDFAGRLVYDDKRREVINFGKHKGKLAEEVLKTDMGYYGWIMQGDFAQDTKDAFARINLRVQQKRKRN